MKKHAVCLVRDKEFLRRPGPAKRHAASSIRNGIVGSNVRFWPLAPAVRDTALSPKKSTFRGNDRSFFRQLSWQPDFSGTTLLLSSTVCGSRVCKGLAGTK